MSNVQQVKQGLFNKSAIHLLKQGKKSVKFVGPDDVHGKSHVCRYRGDDGCMCAVGALIPDEQYDESMEGRAVSYLLSSFPFAIPELAGLDKLDIGIVEGMLQRLQIIHDRCDPIHWLSELKELASEKKLSFEEVEKQMKEKSQ